MEHSPFNIQLCNHRLQIQGNGPDATKLQIIAAAERMLGEGGIDRVPLHEISSAAGQGNRSAVNYHFVDRQGLIDAIFAARMPSLRKRMRELLAQHSEEELNDTGRLLKILFLPIAEQMDDLDRHSYARFLLQFITHPQIDHMLYHPYKDVENPSSEVISRLCKLCLLDMESLLRRVYLQTLVFLGTLIERDNAVRFSRPVPPLEVLLSETLLMMNRALHAHEGSGGAVA